MPDAAEAVAVHPGIAAERERWLRRNKRYCPQLARDDLHRRRFGDDPDCPLCGGVGWTPRCQPPILLLPAVPPAELRVGDVVLHPGGSGYEMVAAPPALGPFRGEVTVPCDDGEWVLLEADRCRVLRETQP